MRRSVRGIATVLASALLAGCGGGAPEAPVPAREFDDPGFVAAGAHELRYGAMQASSLPADVASAYGIERRAGLLVVNASVLERRPGALPAPVEATVTGTWHGLVDPPMPLGFRAVTAGGAVSYVAEVPIRDREPVVLELAATPSGSGVVLHARLTRRFDVR